MKEKVIANLKIAYGTEIEGYSFYRMAADTLSDEQGKNVFRHLSKEELEHITVLSAVSRSLESGGNWLAYKDAAAQGDMGKGAPIFPQENELTKRLKKNPTEMNAVTRAVELKEKAVNFYSG